MIQWLLQGIPYNMVYTQGPKNRISTDRFSGPTETPADILPDHFCLDVNNPSHFCPVVVELPTNNNQTLILQRLLQQNRVVNHSV